MATLAVQTGSAPLIAPPGADANEEARNKRFGEDIAFGVQQTFACWATDFIDPVVGEKIQKRFGDGALMPKGSTWIGEFTGDTAAFFTFLGVQKFAPGVTRTLHKAVRKLFDSQLERSGRNEIKHWAKENNVTLNSEQYRAKMEEWKEFQSDNIAKSAIISASSVTLNVGTQRAIGNKNKIWVIGVAKLAGAAITLAGMLGLRFALPRTTRTLDEEMGHRYFEPLIRKTQSLFGAEVDEERHGHRHAHRHRKDPQSASHAERSRSEKTTDGPAR